MTLSCNQLTLGYGARAVINDLSLALQPGRITTLIGPNGCGKSTLLRGLAGLLKPQRGQALLDGRALAGWPRKRLARRLAFLAQSSLPPEGLTVREMVRHGRFPHLALFQGEGAADRAAVDWALKATDMAGLAGRLLTELSGGERQRAWIAMALAQQADILLLDEPTSYLDLRHQLEVLQLLQELNAGHGLTILMSLHDLNQAMRFSHHTVVLEGGRVAASGAPAEIIDAGLLRRVFQVEATLIARGDHQAPICHPEAAVRAPAVA
jgi:ABC-type cobalamin/Fe3+-siderophores transport system ATPase subunit